MLLTITTTHNPATDLGFLLHKHPDKLQTFDLSFGKAHVFYPEATKERCTAALQLEIDPIGLVRSIKSGGRQRLLEDYVNDRPYVASSFFSVALNRVFRSAFTGSSRDRQELAESAMPLEAVIHCLPSRGGEAMLRRLFEPLGYEVSTESYPLDAEFDDWGNSPYLTVTITGSKRLCDLLRHLYVLIPVLDRKKHYWVGDDEVEKLLRHGEDWLESHPEKELIASRYLKQQRSLARAALERLAQDEGISASEEEGQPDREQVLEAPLRLNDRRIDAIVEAVKSIGAGTVIDLGCGEGKLIRKLLGLRKLGKIVGVDVSSTALEYAERRLRLQQMPENQRRRVELMNGSVTYRDARLNGFDVAVAAEVIEHIDLDRLGAFERSVFEFAKPGAVIITTPNAEYNATFENMKPGQMRHPDHRFEWTRAEFAAWCAKICQKYGYGVEHRGVGDPHTEFGASTQMAIFMQAPQKPSP